MYCDLGSAGVCSERKGEARRSVKDRGRKRNDTQTDDSALCLVGKSEDAELEKRVVSCSASEGVVKGSQRKRQQLRSKSGGSRAGKQGAGRSTVDEQAHLEAPNVSAVVLGASSLWLAVAAESEHCCWRIVGACVSWNASMLGGQQRSLEAQATETGLTCPQSQVPPING